MKTLFSCLLFSSLCSLSSWGISGTLVVVQTPDRVIVTEGDSVHIECCWNLNSTRIRVRWLKDAIEATDGDKLFFQHKGPRNCVNFTVSNVSTNDAGTIICQVLLEIPTLKHSKGNGTLITVTSYHKTDQENVNAGPSMASALCVGIPLALLSPLFLMALIRLRRLQNIQGAARVIYQTPNQNSEEPEGDGHSTSSSRGSTQWYQVPVYESCDYFERVEDKVKK